MQRTVLVTGSAGFIGFHTARRLLRDGVHVVGVDNLNPYYDVTLKQDRLCLLEEYPGFTGVEIDLVDAEALQRVFRTHEIDEVVHLAAQVGVRASLTMPRAYIDANIVGFLNVLECCRACSAQHLVYASSSSVYGGNTTIPHSIQDRVDHPISLYAATKRSNELMAHSYSHLFGLPTTGLRFFTVYGPWGRPDMALFLFARAIVEGDSIDVFNHGEMMRDFTFVDDIVEGIVRILDMVPPSDLDVPYCLYNLGNGEPQHLMRVIEELELALGRAARKNFLSLQPGDMKATHADVSQLHKATGYRPTTDLKKGVRAFVDWFCSYYGVS